MQNAECGIMTTSPLRGTPPKIFQISRGELHLSTFNSQFSCDSLYVHSVILSKKSKLSIASVKPQRALRGSKLFYTLVALEIGVAIQS